MAVAERVKRVFSIQEERKRQYGKLAKAQSAYSSGESLLEQYQTEIQAVTTVFSRLSQDVLSQATWFREKGRGEVAAILEALQLREKEKLQLTVQYEVKKQEHKQQEDAAEDDSFSQTTYETSELRKKLAQVESAITELISDLRFECESELLAMAAEN